MSALESPFGLRHRPRRRSQGLRHDQRQTVLDCNRFGFDRERPGLQARAFGRHRDGPRNEGRAHGDAIDAALGVQEEIAGGVGLAGVIAAAPDGRAVG